MRNLRPKSDEPSQIGIQAVEAGYHLYYEPTNHTAGVEQATRRRRAAVYRGGLDRVVGRYEI
jgi:hypothetical protein